MIEFVQKFDCYDLLKLSLLKGDKPGEKLKRDCRRKCMSAILLTCVGFGKRGEFE